MMALLIEKRSLPLEKVKKNIIYVLILIMSLKICAAASNGSRVVVSHQVFSTAICFTMKSIVKLSVS